MNQKQRGQPLYFHSTVCVFCFYTNKTRVTALVCPIRRTNKHKDLPSCFHFLRWTFVCVIKVLVMKQWCLISELNHCNLEAWRNLPRCVFCFALPIPVQKVDKINPLKTFHKTMFQPKYNLPHVQCDCHGVLLNLIQQQYSNNLLLKAVWSAGQKLRPHEDQWKLTLSGPAAWLVQSWKAL